MRTEPRTQDSLSTLIDREEKGVAMSRGNLIELLETSQADACNAGSEANPNPGLALLSVGNYDINVLLFTRHDQSWQF